MEWLIDRVLRKISAKKLARSFYAVIRKKIEKLVLSTETDFDDQVLELIDALVEALIGEIKEA